MKIHIVMMRTYNSGWARISSKVKPHSVHSTRKIANKIAKEKNSKASRSEYWVVSKEVKE